MKLQTETKQKIARDAIMSIFLYVLPVVLMLLTFYITGQRPWQKSPAAKAEIKK